MIPYGRQCLDASEIEAVVDVLKSDWLTTGPKVEEFEEKVVDYVGAKYGVAISSGTAAMHAAMNALDIGPGDEVIVPTMSFVATANSVVYQKGTPVFADVDPKTLLVSIEDVESKITKRTKAIIAVDYAGHPCDYDQLRWLADRHDLYLIADSCHALGATYKKKPVGLLGDLAVFSFHPVKHITTGEGGMIITNDAKYAEKMRRFRNHGIDINANKRMDFNSWYYEMIELGFNYRITDIQCAIGIKQMDKIDDFLKRRRDIALYYSEVLNGIDNVEVLCVSENVEHAYHLYVIRIKSLNSEINRNSVFTAMRNNGVGVNVHYIPIHLHPFYRKYFGTREGDCIVAETAYTEILSLPIYPALSLNDMNTVISSLNSCVCV